jgi:hypothetical protein
MKTADKSNRRPLKKSSNTVPVGISGKEEALKAKKEILKQK